MDELVAYMQHLEVLAFFAGYPVVYAIVNLLAGTRDKAGHAFFRRTAVLLPLSYALTGTLFLGMTARNIFSGLPARNILLQFHAPFLQVWGLLAVLFWLPFFFKRTYLSLLHSMLIFLFLVKDLVEYMTSATGNEFIRNDMKVFTDSLLLNSATLFLVVLVHYGIHYIRKMETLP